MKRFFVVMVVLSGMSCSSPPVNFGAVHKVACDELTYFGVNIERVMAGEISPVVIHPNWCVQWRGPVLIRVIADLKYFRIDGKPQQIPQAGCFDREGRVVEQCFELSINTAEFPDGMHVIDIQALQWNGSPYHLQLDVPVNNAKEFEVPVARFTDVTIAAGLPEQIVVPPGNETYVEHGWGALAGDINGDSKLDVVIWGPAGAQAYCQDTLMHFSPCGPSMNGAFHSAALCDLDNDGRLDLIMGSGRVSLYRNVGGALVEQPSSALTALGDNRIIRGITCTDVNRDGKIDLALADFASGGFVFQNQGGWQFLDVSSVLGLVPHRNGGAFALAVDTVAPSSEMTIWLMTEGFNNGDTMQFSYRYEDQPLPRLVRARPTKEEGMHAMGSAYLQATWRGQRELFDLIMTAYDSVEFFQAPDYWDNAGANAGFGSIIGNKGRPVEGWSTLVGNFFNTPLGVVIVTDQQFPTGHEVNPLLFFAADTAGWMRTSAPGLTGNYPCRSAFAADLNNDGNSDVLIGCTGGVRVLLNNASPGSGRTVVLRGTTSNPHGIGAVIETPSGERRLVRGGGNPHAGGVTVESVFAPTGALTITWPSGQVQEVPVGNSPVISVTE